MCARLVNGCEGDIANARRCQVAVDLVGENNNPVRGSQFSNRCQILTTPYLTRRVLWIAENEQCCLGVSHFRFEIVPVDAECAIFIDQVVALDLASGVSDAVEEDIVDRCLNQDIPIRLSKCPNQRRNCGDNTHAEQHPRGINVPGVAAIPPRSNGLGQLGRNLRVAINSGVGFARDRLNDVGSRAEVHVRDPHRQLPRSDIPLLGIGVASVKDRIKVIHGSTLLELGSPPRVGGYRRRGAVGIAADLCITCGRKAGHRSTQVIHKSFRSQRGITLT